MNPILDHVLVSVIVSSALSWFAWRAVRRKAGACRSGCGCETKRPAK